MKKWKLWLAAGALVLACAGCGTKEAAVDQKAEEAPSAQVQTTSDQSESEVEEKNDNYDDLEEKAALGETAEFAAKIQEAVAAKDMEAFADLCAYPLAVNGEAVETRDAFIELGSDVIFTEERCAVIEAVDVSTLEETMAGVIMGDDVPNIIFKSVDGKLGITGIN